MLYSMVSSAWLLSSVRQVVERHQLEPATAVGLGILAPGRAAPTEAMTAASSTLSSRVGSTFLTTNLLGRLMPSESTFAGGAAARRLVGARPLVCCGHGHPCSGRPRSRHHPRACRPRAAGRCHLRHRLRAVHGRAQRPRHHPLRRAGLPAQRSSPTTSTRSMSASSTASPWRPSRPRCCPAMAPPSQRAGCRPGAWPGPVVARCCTRPTPARCVKTYAPGSFLAFTDHINFSGFNPLATEREGIGWGTPYLSMAELMKQR